MKNIDRAKAIYLAARGASWNLAGDANKALRQELMTVLTGKKHPIAVCGVTHLDAAIRAELKSSSHGLALEKEIAAWCGYTGPLQAMAPAKEKPQPETMDLPVKFIGSASTDPTREIINGIFIDAEKRAVVATNGRILAKLDIPGTAAIKGGVITPQLWKTARAMTKKGPLALDFVNGTIATLPYPQDQATGSYPNWPAVVPVIDKPAYRLCLDPALLLDLAESLGRHDQAKGITLDLDASCETPIVVTLDGNSGVIMPMNDKDNSKGHGLRVTAPQTERSAPPAVIDRTEMMRDPIPWLRRLEVELRHLGNNHPQGGQWISEYLEVISDEEHGWTIDELDDKDETIDKYAEEIAALQEKLDQLDGTTPESETITRLQAQLAEAQDNLVGMEHERDTYRGKFIALGLQLETSPQKASGHDAAVTAYLEEKAKNMELEARLHALQLRLPTPALDAMINNTPAAEAERSAPPAVAAASSTAPVLSRNDEKNGIELRFPEKPTDTVRAAMKDHGFKWSAKQPGQPWYARYSEERWVFAMDISGQGIAPADIIEPEAMAPAPTEMEPHVSSTGWDDFGDF